MKIHHIGYLVGNIEAAKQEFDQLGFSQIGEIVEDKLREVYILFLENNGYTIELIQPIDVKSPMYKLQKKHGSSPYHVCYKTDKLQNEIENMINSKKCTLLQPPQEAPAISNRMVAFLVNSEIGIIELIEPER